MRKTVNDFGEGGRHVVVVFCVCFTCERLLRSVQEALLAFERQVGWIQ